MDLEIIEPLNIEEVISEEVIEKDIELIKEAAQPMIKLCVENGGIGLAAPQVGIFKRFFIMETKEGIFEIIINPRLFKNGKVVHTIEGCLSYGDQKYYLKRWKSISAVYYAIANNKLVRVSRKFSNERAFSFQHETDHLDGVTIKTKGEKL